MPRRLTLASVLYLSIAALVVLLGGLLAALYQGSRRAIVESSAALRDSASARAAAQVEGYLGQAEAAVAELERRLRDRACSLDDAAAVESCLFATAAANPNLSEITLTHATRTGFAANGEPILARDGVWQTSVLRERRSGASLCTRRTERAGDAVVATMACREPGRMLLPSPPARRVEGEIADPSQHLTFTTPASADHTGRLVWTDLSYAELDAELPPARRRVVVTVMKAIEGPAGLVGVARVGLLADQIDTEVAAIHVNADRDDPFRVFLVDPSGRLITRASPRDVLAADGDDLRVTAGEPSPVIAAAVAAPALARAAEAGAVTDGQFELAGRTYTVSFRPIARSQSWLVGVVGPQDYYLGALRGTLRGLLGLTAAITLAVVLGGVLVLRALRRGLSAISREAERMNAFDFAPSVAPAQFPEVATVLASVEHAKTAMRAMRRYVPIEVVRYFYEANREPELGGRLADVTLLFTDVRDFTSHAEALEPDRLARLLGHYFTAMTAAVQGADGTVDKYIGDAVMAIWNAPRACADHPIKACEAALACVERTRALYASPAWEGLPELVTRFGLHRDRVMVGHFGAPDRMSFTAIGDGVNLAARLEGLNKHYGTTILVSEAVERVARARFVFRRLDRVAVKGKARAVEVFELVGGLDVEPARLAVVRSYERALAAYFARDFGAALALLAELGDDPPARVLRERCEALRDAPPPAEWDGVFVARAK